MIGKNFEKKILAIAFLIFCDKIEEIYPAYGSKHMSNPMTYGKSKRRRMGLSCSKKVPPLLIRIILILIMTHDTMSCLHSFTTEKKIQLHKKCAEIKVIVMLWLLLKTLRY